MSRTHPSHLSQNPEFRKLWFGQTVSAFGSLVSGIAVPFTAVLVIKATAVQMGMLAAAGQGPGLVLGLAAGAWVDRLRRRPVLICADILRAVLLLAIPLLYWAGRLSMLHLYLVVAGNSALRILFDAAYRSYLPSVVNSDQLTEGNSKLSATAALAETGGFSLGGILVRSFGPALAVLIDAASFVVSAASLLLIRCQELPPPTVEQREPLGREIREGLLIVWRQPLLRSLAAAMTILSLAGGIISATILLFLTRELGLRPDVQGIIFSAGGLSSLAAAAAAPALERRLGMTRTVALCMLSMGFGFLCIALSQGPILLIVTLQIMNQLFTDGAYVVFEIIQMSLRQQTVPDRTLGRVTATIGVATGAASLAGAIGGGFLAEHIGLRNSLLIAAWGPFLALLSLRLTGFFRADPIFADANELSRICSATHGKRTGEKAVREN